MTYALQHRPTDARVKTSNTTKLKKKLSGTPGGCLRLSVYGRLSLVSRVLKINDDDDADDNSRRRDTGRTIFKLAEDTIIVLYGLQTDYDCSADRINAHKSELKPVGWLVWCRTDHCSVKAPLAISTAQTTL